jgi:Ser/Thr protein kinase RdoA (MazF antagonist)
MKANTARLAEILRLHYGFEVRRFTQLSGWYDTNFKVESSSGKDYFLKIYGRDKLPAVLFQIEFIELLRRARLPAAKVIASRSGKGYFMYLDKPAIIQEFLRGKHLSEVTPSSQLLCAVGKTLGRIARATEGKRLRQKAWKKYLWDLAQFELVLKDYSVARRYVPKRIQNLIKTVVSDWKHEQVRLRRLPQGVIHNDFHGKNILVQGNRCTGITDFGDVNYSWLVGDVVVPLEQVCFQKRETILTHSRALLEGYSQVRKLSALEKELLPLLVRMRATVLSIETPHDFKTKPPGIYRDFLRWAHLTLKYFSNPKNEKKFREMLKTV